MISEREAYVYIQLPGTLDTVPAALLKVQTLPDGTQIGRFRYGDRYLQRAAAVALDPYRLPLDKTVYGSPSSRAFPARCAMRARTPGGGESSSTSSNAPPVICMKSTTCYMARRMAPAT